MRPLIQLAWRPTDPYWRSSPKVVSEIQCPIAQGRTNLEVRMWCYRRLIELLDWKRQHKQHRTRCPFNFTFHLVASEVGNAIALLWINSRCLELTMGKWQTSVTSGWSMMFHPRIFEVARDLWLHDSMILLYYTTCEFKDKFPPPPWYVMWSDKKEISFIWEYEIWIWWW